MGSAMLEELLTHIHNWFEVEAIRGTYTVDSHTIDGLGKRLQDGQFYRIVGSVFNDGLHRWPERDLKDETFTGAVYPLAIPYAVVRLSYEIEDWIAKYGDQSVSPLQSESFGGYSYTKASGRSQDSSTPTWQSVFCNRLNPWRKIA